MTSKDSAKTPSRATPSGARRPRRPRHVSQGGEWTRLRRGGWRWLRLEPVASGGRALWLGRAEYIGEHASEAGMTPEAGTQNLVAWFEALPGERLRLSPELTASPPPPARPGGPAGESGAHWTALNPEAVCGLLESRVWTLTFRRAEQSESAPNSQGGAGKETVRWRRVTLHGRSARWPEAQAWLLGQERTGSALKEKGARPSRR